MATDTDPRRPEGRPADRPGGEHATRAGGSPRGDEHYDAVEHQGYDRELSIRWIVVTGLGLLALTVLTMALMYWMYFLLERTAVERDRELTPVEAELREQRRLESEARRELDELEPPGGFALPEGSTPPPGPLLQASPSYDMERLRERHRRRLETYGWVDREAGVARIPIERAMLLVIEREAAALEGGGSEAAEPEPVLPPGAPVRGAGTPDATALPPASGEEGASPQTSGAQDGRSPAAGEEPVGGSDDGGRGER